MSGHLQQDVLGRENDAYEFLAEYYENLGNFENKSTIVNTLREIARDLETFPLERKADLDGDLTTWEQEGTYEQLEVTLSMIPRDDRTICIEAHDLATQHDHATEFATVNPNDFVANGVEEAILRATELDRIHDLSQ